jgi:hypothetical protein
MEKNNKLEVGEKYLNVSILGGKSVACFKNKNKTGQQPDYKGDGVAIWITSKKASKDELKVTHEDF